MLPITPLQNVLSHIRADFGYQGLYYKKTLWPSQNVPSPNPQDEADNDYVNVNPVTSDPAPRVDSGGPDDVHYASVRFKSSRGQEVPLYSTVQKPKLRTQLQQQRVVEEAEYAAVKFSTHNTAFKWVK